MGRRRVNLEIDLARLVTEINSDAMILDFGCGSDANKTKVLWAVILARGYPLAHGKSVSYCDHNNTAGCTVCRHGGNADGHRVFEGRGAATADIVEP